LSYSTSPETGSCWPPTHDPSASASQVAGIMGVGHDAWQ
jgi:hypothetical protein